MEVDDSQNKVEPSSTSTLRTSSIPLELDNMLLDFTINVILENPENIYDYAAEYFARLRDEKNSYSVDGVSDSVDPLEDEKIAVKLGARSSRRTTICGESYNPEEDVDEDVLLVPKSDEEKRRIKERVKDVFILSVIEDSAVDDVIEAMEPRKVSKGDVIIQQGDDGDYFYMIDKGTFEAYLETPGGEMKHLKTYENSGSFGELALLHNQPRAATIVAATDGELWAVSRYSFNRLVVRRAFDKRKAYMELLDGVPELQPITKYEKMQVCDALMPRDFPAGEEICHEGDEGDGMYFVQEGKVEIIKDGKKVSELGKGEYFGEMALIKKKPRAATVKTIEDSTLVFLDVNAFERLLGPCIDIMKGHMETYK